MTAAVAMSNLVLDELREKIASLEGGSARKRNVLPFGVPAIDAQLPGGGLVYGALHEVAGALEKSLAEPESVKLAWKPNLTVEVAESDAQTLLKLVDALEDDDDVQTVWGNYEVSDEVMEKLG